MINDATHNRNIAIGKIIISESSALLDADSHFADAIVRAFRHQMICGKHVQVEVAGVNVEGADRKRPPRGSRPMPFRKASKAKLPRKVRKSPYSKKG